MAAKEEKPLKISAVSVDKSLEDWKKVKALYKESFTSAQRAPFRWGAGRRVDLGGGDVGGSLWPEQPD